jgi:hypothetical protein
VVSFASLRASKSIRPDESLQYDPQYSSSLVSAILVKNLDGQTHRDFDAFRPFPANRNLFLNLRSRPEVCKG